MENFEIKERGEGQKRNKYIALNWGKYPSCDVKECNNEATKVFRDSRWILYIFCDKHSIIGIESGYKGINLRPVNCHECKRTWYEEGKYIPYHVGMCPLCGEEYSKKLEQERLNLIKAHKDETKGPKCSQCGSHDTYCGDEYWAGTVGEKPAWICRCRFCGHSW